MVTKIRQVKRCNKCEVEKSLACFHRDSQSPDGLKSSCKDCRCADSRERYLADPERAKRLSRAWERENPERTAERVRRWRAANPEKQAEYERRWREKNRAKVSAYQRAYYAAHRERLLRLHRMWREANWELARASEDAWAAANRVKRREYQHRRRAAVKRSAVILSDLLEVLVEQPCAYCGATEHIEIDHVVPLSRGGTHTPENLAPACGSCNRSKGAKLLEEWLPLRAA